MTVNANAGTSGIAAPGRGAAAEDGLWEVYYRPPERDLTPERLLRVLRTAFAAAAAASAGGA